MNNDFDSNSPEVSEHLLPSEPLRESLSALLDGELGTTESAFLIKRMAHDADLNAQWQRFQGIGEVLRGQAQILEHDNFSARVLSRIALAETQLANATHAFPEPEITATKHKFNRQTFQRFSAGTQPLKRFGAGVAIAAAVAWAALLLPQRYQADLSPPLAAQTEAPFTLASPVVSMRTVSGHIGGEVTSNSDQNEALLAQSMNAFLLEHVQRSSVSPTSDAVYLQNISLSDTPETNWAPQ